MGEVIDIGYFRFGVQIYTGEYYCMHDRLSTTYNVFMESRTL